MRLKGTTGTKNLFLIGFVICFMLLSASLAEDSYAIVVRNDREVVVFSEDFESYDENFLDFTPIIGDVGISPSGHYFTYKGKTKMILADSGTQCVMQNLNIDYRAWVNATAAEGHSSLHIWAFIAPRQKLDGSGVESRYGYVYPGITPWARKTSGDNAHDCGKQWDLFSFDEGTDPDQYYWPRLRDLCQRLKDKNMTLGITVFFGWPRRTNDLYYHPFYHLNGGPATSRGDITHIHSAGTEIHTQAWNDSWPVRKKTQWLWEKFCLKLINETSDYGNVWFDFRDEWGYDDDTNMETHFRHFFMSRGQIWADRSSVANFRVLNAVGEDDVPPFGSTPAMKTEGGPYDHNGVRVEVWTRAMAGIHYLLHNDARSPGIMAWDPNTGRDPDDDLGRKYVGYASRFFNTHLSNLDAMVPNNGLVNNGAKCLANPGNEYVAYLPNGGSVTVELSDASGILNVEWYNPKDGTYYSKGTVTGGGCETFTPPFTGGAVLHISTDTFPPRTTSVITPTPNDAGWNNVTQGVVTFFRADNSSGISYTNYSKTSETGPWTTVGTSAATGPDAVNVTDIHEANFNVTVLKEGPTEIWYYSVDNNSNIEHTKNVTVRIDTAPPIITIHSPKNKTYITKIIPLNFTTNEPLDTCLLSVDSTPNQTNCKNQAVISREYEAREGTVAWWHFNGDAIDTSGNNNHGTITGASFVDGKFDSALNFDGINDRVYVNDSDSFDTINKTITIEAWIKPVLTGNRTAIFYKENCFGFEITVCGNLSFVLCDINASCQRFDSKGTVKNNTWNNVAGTSDGTTMRIYINGEQDNITYPAPARIYTSNYSASIGIWLYNESSFDSPFNGDIEELRILNRCLSEEQIKSDYALGEGSHSVTVYGSDTAGNWNSSTVYFNIVTVTPVFDIGSGTYPSISGLHNGTLKPNQTITVYKMYTYPCPGTSGHSEYVRIYNKSETVAKGNWTGYGSDWHNISFDDPFVLKANETYDYTLHTGSYPQIIHKPTANVTGGTITCEEFVGIPMG